jgi:hypothetical protein
MLPHGVEVAQGYGGRQIYGAQSTREDIIHSHTNDCDCSIHVCSTELRLEQHEETGLGKMLIGRQNLSDTKLARYYHACSVDMRPWMLRIGGEQRPCLLIRLRIYEHHRNVW